MIRYTPERGYGLDLSGPEPVWRGKRRRWNWKAAMDGWNRRFDEPPPGAIEVDREWSRAFIRRPRIDDYIKKGLIDPARRAYL